jgi:glucosamine-6-phosphate deaminase
MQLPDCFAIPAADLTARSPVPLTLLPSAGALHTHFARAIADEIKANNHAGRATRLILPVGPTGQYPLLADICNRERIRWRDCHIFFMDEYCDWHGRWVDAAHPLSFRGHAQRALFGALEAALAPPPAQVHFPDPRALDAIGDAIAAAGGVDSCYGGIGIHGHVAFNEAPISRWYSVSPAEFKLSRTRLLSLAEETMVLNASRGAGGWFPALPPMAVTIGMGDILAARRIRLYCDGGVWQRAVLRIALFGSPAAPLEAGGEDVNWPVTLLRHHGDFALVADAETAAPPL